MREKREALITMFVESRAQRGEDGVVRSQDQNLIGDRWQADLRGHPSLRLALRIADTTVAVEGAGVDGQLVALPHYVGLASLLRTLPRLVAAIDSAVKTSDVVSARLPGVIGLIAAASARYRRKPLAVHVVGDVADVLRSGIAGRAGAALAPLAAASTRSAVRSAALVRYVTDQALQERYRPSSRAFVVSYSDVQLDAGAPRIHSRVPGRIIAVGSQEQPYKGHHILIEAVASLIATDAHVHLELVGSGRQQPRLRAIAEARGIGDRVHFVGQVADRDELIGLLDRADVFVMPSLTEGLPRALIEAMSRGLPAIGSDVGGIPELLPASALFPAGDPDALAQLLHRALHDSRLREELTTAGRETVGRFQPHVLEARRQEWSRAIRDVGRVRTAPA